MNKYQQATTFYNHYVRLSDSKKEEFSRLCNKILSYNYICASRPQDQDDYYKIVSELDLYVQYFALMDYVVEHHQVDKVINLYNLQNYNRYTLKKNESIVLLLLRRFYYQKMQEVSLIDQITMTMEELHDAMLVTGLFEKRINKGEMRDILRILRRYHIIDTTGQSDDDQSIIIIYPTILYVLPVQQIEDIDHRLAEYSRQGGDKSEEAREDEDY